MLYTSEDYFLFYLALILFFGILALLDGIIEWREKRKAIRRERQLRSLNRREEMQRRHKVHLAQMNEVLDSVNRERDA